MAHIRWRCSHHTNTVKTPVRHTYSDGPHTAHVWWRPSYGIRTMTAPVQHRYDNGPWMAHVRWRPLYGTHKVTAPVQHTYGDGTCTAHVRWRRSYGTRTVTALVRHTYGDGRRVAIRVISGQVMTAGLRWWREPFWPQRLYLWYHTLISRYARMAIDQIYQPLVSVTTWFYNHSYNHGTILVLTSTHYLSFFQYLIWS